jgi:demethoxyubiquinone hydroxylase (CLK1/Coq7/Cat5 family)
MYELHCPNVLWSYLLQRIHMAEHADPEIAEGLRHMREEEKRHREEIMDMLMKSDAYALPPPQG